MKRLILMRHAKSDWSSGASSDHDRPLNPRGQRAAAALGKWLVETDLIPDQVLSSSAQRTQETYQRLNLPEGTEAHFLRPLYLASQDTILAALQQATGDRVLMLGHNPGIGICAEGILAAPPDHAQFARYPTGATLVADFDITSWDQATWGKAIARHFIVPRDL